MPIYEYRCGACGHVFEEIASASCAELPDCPQCKAKNAQKQLSAPAIHCGESQALKAMGAASAASSGCGGGAGKFS
jgi:putative FmdB family regulatory protein